MKFRMPSKEWLLRMAELEDRCMSVSAGCAIDPHPWRSWLRRILFPAKYCERPETDFDSNDCVIVYSVTRLSFVDRIRCLLTGVVVVTSRTSTEHEIGRTATNSTCHIGVWSDFR